MRRTVGPWSVGLRDSWAQFLKWVYNSTFLNLSWFLCQTFAGVIKLDCCFWALSGPEGGRTQFLECMYNSTFLILSWFVWQTFWGAIKLDHCLGWGEGTIFYYVCTIQQSWLYPDLCDKHLGELSSWIIVFGGRAQFLNWLYSNILIFLPKT